MRQTSLTALFSIYIALAIGYNLMSMVLREFTGRRAADTDPMIGMLFITVLYLVHAVGPTFSGGLYLFVMSAFALLLLRVGIVKHIAGYSEDAYFSRLTWAAAFLINSFGVIVLTAIIFATL